MSWYAFVLLWVTLVTYFMAIYITVSGKNKKMYRYNGKILQMLTDNVKNIRVDYNGYRPVDGVMNYEVREKKEPPIVKVDSKNVFHGEVYPGLQV